MKDDRMKAMTTGLKTRRPVALMLLFAILMIADVRTVVMSEQANHFADARAEMRDVEAENVRLETYGVNESARSNKITGGKIQQAALEPGNPVIKITVNLPAFLMTLWQEEREIDAYGIGIGLKSYPVTTGERRATRFVYNPRWIPPDSNGSVA
jgi:hypothetical protein